MKQASPFAPLSSFQPAEPGYRLLPFRFMRWSGKEVLLVNEVGEYCFLPSQCFQEVVAFRLKRSSLWYRKLKARHFLADTESDLPVELLATKYRTKKGFLQGFTGLHLFVLTLRCDHTCRYCQVSRVTEDRTRFDMSEETALRALDLMFRSPSPHLKVEFQGGEPLLNFDLLRQVVLEARQRNVAEKRDLEFVVTTNLAPLTDGMLAFLAEQQVLVSTSLDGPAWLHNANRPRPGHNSFEVMQRSLYRAREALGPNRVAAIMTTTQRSLGAAREIVDEYVRLGFDAIFLRPISPYGFAVRTGEALRYQTDQFVEFYKEALRYIVELNRQGTDLLEIFSQILLTKMLTPFATGYVDLQSPAGAGLGVVAYNYDGNVYASDESRMLAEMGDHSFCLGNLHEHTYEEIFGGAALRALVAGSVAEALPGCADCAFVPYCGADPVFHHRTQGDFIGHRPTSAFCARNMAIMRHLFELIRKGDEFVRDLFLSWATRFRLEEIDEVDGGAA